MINTAHVSPQGVSALGRLNFLSYLYRGAYKSLALPGRKQATATEDFDVNISYL